MCESPNADDALECAVCGKQLLLEMPFDAVEEPLEGLEQTLLDPLESAAGAIAPIADLETTQLLDSKKLNVTVEAIEVERTPIEARLDLPSNWTGEADPDLAPTRIADDGERTAAPKDTGYCPWCGAPATGAVCDKCGRRRSRYTAEAAAPVRTGPAETLLCPACFSRVDWGVKCEECGTPLPLREF